MKFKCVTIIVLGMLVLGFSNVVLAKDPQANGVPFQQLQQQIDILQHQITHNMTSQMYAIGFLTR